VMFVGVALDNKDRLETFLQQIPFKYSIVENGRFLSDRYGVKSYPTHVIIDQQGKVYFQTTGLAPNTVYWIRKSISELVNSISPNEAAEEKKN